MKEQYVSKLRKKLETDESKAFRKRFKQARNDKGKKQNEIAKDLYVTVDTIRNWEQGFSMPGIDTLISICNYFGCSIDYMLGKMDERSHDARTLHEMTGLSEKAVMRLVEINLYSDPSNITSDSNVIIPGDDFPEEVDDAELLKRAAIRNKMVLDTLSKIICNAVASECLMNYMYLDRIHSIKVDGLTIPFEYGIGYVNGFIPIGSGAIKSGLLTELGKALDEIIDESEDDDRAKMYASFLGDKPVEMQNLFCQITSNSNHNENELTNKNDI